MRRAVSIPFLPDNFALSLSLSHSQFSSLFRQNEDFVAFTAKKMKMKMKMKKNCELCQRPARMHCDSDQASLCWTCDFNVHSANFLVARHSRTLLCHVCQSPTRWTATGTKLGHTVSVCDNCVRTSSSSNEEIEIKIESENRMAEGREPEDDDSDEEEDDDEDNDEEEENEEDEDNQVVPWSPTTPPPPLSSSCNSDEEYDSSSSSSSTTSRRDRTQPYRKRMRKSVSDLCSNAFNFCTSTGENVNKSPETATGGGGGGRVEFFDSLSTIGEGRVKRRRLQSGRVELPGQSPWAIVESVKRLHRQEMGSPAAIANFCRISEDPSAVDCDSSECS